MVHETGFTHEEAREIRAVFEELTRTHRRRPLLTIRCHHSRIVAQVWTSRKRGAVEVRAAGESWYLHHDGGARPASGHYDLGPGIAASESFGTTISAQCPECGHFKVSGSAIVAEIDRVDRYPRHATVAELTAPA